MTMTDQPLVHPGLGAQALPTAPTPVQPPAAGGGAAASLREELTAELAKAQKLPLLTLPVRSRRGWDVVYDPMMDSDLLKAVTRDIDPANDGEFEIALRVLPSQCRGFLRHGEPVILDGERLTFTSLFIRDTFGAVDAISAVRAFYADDTVVGWHYRKLQEASASGLDPTDESPGS